jgi:ABC-type Fe3+-hydroxamate transport system substrate-binding protein
MSDYLFTDQMNRKIQLDKQPIRIISLVPSQTELLYSLGLDEEIVGQTKFCIHPKEKHQTKTIVGGTKNIDFETIAILKPDLIIGNKEENDQKQMEYLMQHYQVWMSDINNLNEAYEMIDSLGKITGKLAAADQIIYQIKYVFKDLENYLLKLINYKKCAYFIWRKPFMVAGNNTFINYILEYLKFENVFLNETERYPATNAVILAEKNPEIVFLSSEPYPFKQKHIDEIQHILPNAKILLVDGEMFSWYGSRLIKSAPYFKRLLAML